MPATTASNRVSSNSDKLSTVEKKDICVTRLKGVGPQVAQRLARLGIFTIRDVLFHLPHRYQDRTRIVPIAGLQPGSEVVVQGLVRDTKIQFGKRRSLICTIADDTGSLKLRFFHFSASQKAALSEGTCIRCFGEVRASGQFGRSRFSGLEMIHPEYQYSDPGAPLQAEECLTPVYPATEGLQQRSLRAISEQALAYLNNNTELLDDWLTDSLPDDIDVMSLVSAINFLHRPPPDAPVTELLAGNHASQQRLAFEELLARHLCLLQLRKKVQKNKALAISSEDRISAKLDKILPYALTGAQKRCIAEVMDDLGKGYPMQRLVQGDVGCGKTMIAVYSAFYAASEGLQVVIMAPTEILAEQHLNNIQPLASQLGLETVCLTGKIKGNRRADILEKIQSGQAQIIIGTHAVFQDEVNFDRLAYIVVDEQHRFGVTQRLTLLNKGVRNGLYPHQLIMSATPIPRSLAMSIYADLDCSIVDEMPPGRSPVNSVVLPDERRDDILSRIRKACREGRQAYWVCPLIDESEVLQCQAAVETATILSAALPDLRIGLIHGRLKPDEKVIVMKQYKQNNLDILVATTVIEVGVDVPNASLMVIENSERLGLSQLHQLRGRIGRGSQESSCIFLYKAPLSKVAHKRLSIMRNTNDGFEIAREDLALRGPGEVFGTQQSGLMQFKIADLPRDEYLLPKVRKAAEQLLHEHPVAVQSLIERWVGQSARYWEA